MSLGQLNVAVTLREGVLVLGYLPTHRALVGLVLAWPRPDLVEQRRLVLFGVDNIPGLSRDAVHRVDYWLLRPSKLAGLGQASLQLLVGAVGLGRELELPRLALILGQPFHGVDPAVVFLVKGFEVVGGFKEGL